MTGLKRPVRSRADRLGFRNLAWDLTQTPPLPPRRTWRSPGMPVAVQWSVTDSTAQDGESQPAGGGGGHGRSLERAGVRCGVASVAPATRCEHPSGGTRAGSGRAREGGLGLHRSGDPVLRAHAELPAARLVMPRERDRSHTATHCRRGQTGFSGLASGWDATAASRERMRRRGRSLDPPQPHF